jgi:putative peptidoglycan lipid II flippase
MEGLQPALEPLAEARRRPEGGHVITATFLVLGLVGLGKVAGFARDVAVVARFGASPETDGFFTAYALFNVVWVMAIASSVAPAVVPSLARIEIRAGVARRRRAAGGFAAAGFATALVLSLVGIALAEPILRLTAPELTPAAIHSGAESFRILALAFVPIVLAGLLGAVLQAADRFAAAAASTLIVSVTMVAFTFWLGDQLGVQATALGVLVGSVLQLGVLVPSLAAARPFARPRVHEAADLREATLRVGPVSTLAGLVAARPALERSFAAPLGPGLVTLVGLGSRTGSFFASLVGTALATAVLPALSRAAARGDEGALRRTLQFAAAFTIVTSLPAAVGALLLSGDLAALLFRHGSVNAADIALVAATMAAYAPAIVLAPFVDVLTRARYAQGDAATPLVATAVGLLTNAVALAAAPRLGLSAFGLGFTANVLTTLAILAFRERRLVRAMVPSARAMAAAIVATVAAIGAYSLTRVAIPSGGSPAVAGGLVVGGAVYLVIVAVALVPADLIRRVSNGRFVLGGRGNAHR